MSDPTTSPAPASALPPPPPKSRWGRIGQFAIGAVVVILGGIKLLNLFVLPACDASNITDTVRDIFKGKDVALVTFNGIKTISDDPTKTCGAYIESADEKANIVYSVTWEGWSPYVKIEKVDTVAPPAGSEPPPADSQPPPADAPPASDQPTPQPAPVQ